MGIHLRKFDAQAFTGHDVSDDGLGENHASGYFEDEGQIGAYALRDEPQRNRPSMRNVLTRETCCWPPPYQVTDIPLGKEIRWCRRVPLGVSLRMGKVNLPSWVALDKMTNEPRQFFVGRLRRGRKRT